MQSYLVEMIDGRKFSDEKDEKRDLLSNLVNANEELLDDGEQRLGEAELIGMGQHLVHLPICSRACCSGNIFLFYIAGHEVRVL